MVYSNNPAPTPGSLDASPEQEGWSCDWLRHRVDRNWLHSVSTRTLIASYWSSFFTKSPAAPLPWFMNGLTHPMIHRAGYNAGSGMQALASVSQSPGDFGCELAGMAKGTSDIFAKAAMASSVVMLSAMSLALVKTPPKTMSRLGRWVVQTVPGRWLAKRAISQYWQATLGKTQAFLNQERFAPFFKYTAESSAGFCTTGALNSAAAFFTVLGAKLESDYNRTRIVDQLCQIFPELKRKEAEGVFDKVVPHMHLREAGMRLLGAMLSGSASVASGLSNWSDKTKFLDPTSGFLFAAGLIASTWPVGNLPDEKRFNQDMNDWYIRQNEVTKATVALLGAMVSAGFLFMLNGHQPPAAFKWASGKLDNIVQIAAMGVATSFGFDALRDTPAAARSLYGLNPRLSEQRQAVKDLEGLLRQNDPLSESGYAARLSSAVPERYCPAPGFLKVLQEHETGQRTLPTGGSSMARA